MQNVSNISISNNFNSLQLLYKQTENILKIVEILTSFFCIKAINSIKISFLCSAPVFTVCVLHSLSMRKILNFTSFSDPDLNSERDASSPALKCSAGSQLSIE